MLWTWQKLTDLALRATLAAHLGPGCNLGLQAVLDRALLVDGHIAAADQLGQHRLDGRIFRCRGEQ